MSVAARVTGFFTEVRGLPPEKVPAPDASLMDEGYLDSLTMLEFVAYLEETFGIQLGDEDIMPDNFESIDSVVRLVDGKQA